MNDSQRIKLKVQIWMTSILGLFSMGIIICEPAESSLIKWATGVIGILIGYWLK